MKSADSNRRSFLKTLFAGAVTTAVVRGAKEASAGQTLNRQGIEETLYRETEAFKKYYESLRS